MLIALWRISATRAALTVLAVLACPYLAGSDLAPGRKLFEARCVSCHVTEAQPEVDYTELVNRVGPALTSAGSKFNPGFLRRWLVAPTPIRPAGYLPFRQVVSTPQGDRVDPSRIQPHLRLGEAEAAIVSEYLMTLRKEPNQYPIAAPNEDLDPAIHFTKVLGCASCHKAKPDAGGWSAPELYTASARLNKDWVPELVTDPVYWGPMAMPKQNVRSDQLATVVDYLFAITGPSPEYATHPAAAPSGETAKPSSRVETIYEIFCSQCHGITGNGKGINAPMMFVSPRNHTSAQEMGPLTDDRLYAVIRYGGPAVGKSVLMPSWGAVLKDSDIRALVAHLRELSGTQQQATRSLPELLLRPGL